ncbi:MAG: acyltransferase [Lentilitoribacter sp.]
MHKLGGLQFIRAFAAVLVLVGHAIAEAEHYFGISMGLDFIPWTRGVDIFFVVSGFIITLSITRYEGRPFAFLQRRVLRIVPLYYLFTTLMVLTLVVFPNGPKETIFDLGHILTSYGFFPYARPDGRIAPLLSLGWTLNYEMFFYVLCVICMFTRHTTLALTGLIVSIALYGATNSLEASHWVFWTNPIIIEFLFGIFLAKAYQAGWTQPSSRLATVLFLGALVMLVVLDATEIPRFLAAGLPAVLIVAAATLLCPLNFRRWEILGDASFALYLSHRFTLRLTTILLIPVLPPSIAGGWAYVFCVSGVSITVAIVVHLWLELSLLNPAKKRVLT